MTRSREVTQTEPKCFASKCKAPISYRFWKLWDRSEKSSLSCASHRPGTRIEDRPKQFADLKFYRIEAIDGSATFEV